MSDQPRPAPGEAPQPGGAQPPPGEPPPESSSRRSSLLVAAGIFLSRIAGLVRERAMGHFLGTGLAVEAFRAALRIPNLLQNLLGEGVLSASFIPVYARLLSEDREEEAGRVAGAVAGLLTVLSGALVVAGVVFARPLTMLLAAGFTGEKLELTVTLVRIITPGVGFLVLSAWCLGVLNSHRRFFLSYVAPVLWNGVMIAVLVGFGLRGVAGQPLAVALAWGALAGGAAQLAMQVPGVVRVLRGTLRPSVRTDLPGVRSVLRAFGPVVAGRGVVQLAAYVDLFLASFLATGAVAALTYAQVLYTLPISLFGMAVAAAELPDLSSASSADRGATVRRLQSGLARIAFFVVPTTVAYVVLGDLVVGLLYQSGRFGADDALQVAIVLAAYSVGLLATTSGRLLQSALYGMHQPRLPALFSVVRVSLAAVLGLVLMAQLDQVAVTPAGVQVVGELPATALAPEALRGAGSNALRLGAAGLALGSGIAGWAEYALLRRALRRRVGSVRIGGGEGGRIVSAAAVAAVVGLVARPVVAGLPVALAALLALPAVGAAYLAVAYGLRVSEARALLGRLRRT